MELKLGSIPVKIHGWFLIMAVVLGSNERNMAKLALWVAVVVVSVVVHELGHALVGRAFGLIPRIELHGMGGTTSFEARSGEAPKPLGTAKNVAISLAGPFAGFLLAVVVFAIQLGGYKPANPLAVHAIALLFAVNVGWGIFNLLPMLPLDGGNVLRYLLLGLTKDKQHVGEKIARWVSVAVAAGIALLAIRREQWWVLYLGVLFAFRNVQSLRQAGQLKIDQTLADAIDGSYRALDRNEPKTAIGLLAPTLRTEASADLRKVGIQVYIVALLRDERWEEAVLEVERERQLIDDEDLARYVEILRREGRGEEADRIASLGKPAPALSEFRA